VEVTSPKFAFLAVYDEQLVQLAGLAERYFRDDPSTSLIKLRQWGERLAQHVAARTGLEIIANESQADRLRRLKVERVVPPEVLKLFRQMRIVGNRATHDGAGEYSDALANLKLARQLAIWFHPTFGHVPTFKPGPFVPPPDLQATTQELKAELDRLHSQLQTTQTAAEQARSQAAAWAAAWRAIRRYCYFTLAAWLPYPERTMLLYGIWPLR
jgi:type I restriction enzyme, R subunit